MPGLWAVLACLAGNSLRSGKPLSVMCHRWCQVSALGLADGQRRKEVNGFRREPFWRSVLMELSQVSESCERHQSISVKPTTPDGQRERERDRETGNGSFSSLDCQWSPSTGFQFHLIHLNLSPGFTSQHQTHTHIQTHPHFPEGEPEKNTSLCLPLRMFVCFERLD